MRITRVKGDRYAGEWPREQFRKYGIRYDPCEDTKGALYRDFLPLLNSGKVRLLGNKRLANQLIGLERSTARGGRDSIDHARGAHDDLANAVAGVLLAAVEKKPQARIGTYNPTGFDARVHWRGEEPERTRIRVVHLTEKQALKEKGLC